MLRLSHVTDYNSKRVVRYVIEKRRRFLGLTWWVSLASFDVDWHYEKIVPQKESVALYYSSLKTQWQNASKELRRLRRGSKRL